MTIAVDFDGTIVEHRYPAIGRELPFATATLRQLQKEMPDLHLILWTVREGRLLDDAVAWCAERGLTFYAVNANYPEELPSAAPTGCRKVTADLYIDDRNLGTLPSWPAIYRLITGNPAIPQEKTAKKSLLGKLFAKH